MKKHIDLSYPGIVDIDVLISTVSCPSLMLSMYIPSHLFWYRVPLSHFVGKYVALFDGRQNDFCVALQRKRTIHNIVH